MSSLQSDDTRYVKLLLLLLKGGTYVCKKHTLRILDDDNTTIYMCLKTHRDQIYNAFKKRNPKLWELLSPDSGKPKNVDDWDISAHAYVLLNLFDKKSLKDTEKIAITKLRDKRNALAHSGIISLPESQFNGEWSHLSTVLFQLSIRLTDKDQDYVNGLINDISTIQELDKAKDELKPLENTYDFIKEVLAEQHRSYERRLDECLRRISEVERKNESGQSGLDECLRRISEVERKNESGQSESGRRFSELERKIESLQLEIRVRLAVIAPTQTTCDAAHHKLLKAGERCLTCGHIQQDSDEVYTAFNNIFTDMSKEGAHLKKVEEGSVMVTFSCTTWTSLKRAILYLTKTLYSQRLQELEKALSQSVGCSVKLNVNIVLESLLSLLDKAEHGANDKSVVLTMSCDGSKGVRSVCDNLVNGSSTNTVNNLLEALSRSVGQRIDLRASIDVDKLEQEISNLERRYEYHGKHLPTFPEFPTERCPMCNARSNKVKYCIECKGYCCQACTDVHKHFPQLKNHTFLDVSQGGKAEKLQSSLPEFPTETCSLHKGKVLDLYCQDHDSVGCYICIATNHKSCSVHSVSDWIDTLFKSCDTKQINRRMKEITVSMTTISQSKDRKLKEMKEAKNEALEKVDNFEKALISIIKKKAADDLRTEIAKYQEFENEILQEKNSIDTVNDELQQSEGKLKKSKGNRAQNFVCSKQAEKKMQEADKLIKVNQDINTGTNLDAPTCIAFTPNQNLVNYLESLQGIGQVKGLHGIDQVNVRRNKIDLYKIKGRRDIDIRVYDDSRTTCSSHGCCLTQDNKLLVTDVNNHKLKRIDLDTMTVVDYCKLNGYPHGVCCIDDKEAVVTYYNPGRIQFVSLHHKMSPTRQITLPHQCIGITPKDDQLYVTDNGSSLYVYNMTGTLLKTITGDNTGTKIFDTSRHITFNESKDKMFVGDWNKGLVCLDGAGIYLSTYTDSDLKNADGVCVDGNGCVFVVGSSSNNVVQYNEEGKKIGVIVQQKDGLKDPRSVCFHQKLNKLFVTMWNSNVVKMYELE